MVKSFEMIKFRSMRDAIDKEGNLLPDSERLTSFGAKLRSTSLDELPGLWNVLKGDMKLGKRTSTIIRSNIYLFIALSKHAPP